jgi:cysteine-rich repeat protein
VPLLKGGTPQPDLRGGIQRNRLYCYDGDGRCDFDGQKDNNSCIFHAALCINNTDLRLERCSPSDNHVFEIQRPRFDRLKDQADADNLAAIESGAGLPPLGLNVLRKDELAFVGGPNLDQNVCTEPLEFIVPLKQTISGRVRRANRTLRFSVTRLDGRRDADSLRLECRPSSCGNGEIENDHEQCDDGNRDNGDGCNQACQIEIP